MQGSSKTAKIKAHSFLATARFQTVREETTGIKKKTKH